MKYLPLILLFIGTAHAAEYSVELPITAKIISAEDTASICGDDNPPHWCAKYLSNLEPEAGPQGEYVENPDWLIVEEETVYE